MAALAPHINSSTPSGSADSSPSRPMSSYVQSPDRQSFGGDPRTVRSVQSSGSLSVVKSRPPRRPSPFDFAVEPSSASASTSGSGSGSSAALSVPEPPPPAFQQPHHRSSSSSLIEAQSHGAPHMSGGPPAMLNHHHAHGAPRNSPLDNNPSSRGHSPTYPRGHTPPTNMQYGAGGGQGAGPSYGGRYLHNGHGGANSASPVRPHSGQGHNYSSSQGSLPLAHPQYPKRIGQLHSSHSSVSSIDFSGAAGGWNDSGSIRRASTSSPALNDMATQFANASMFDLSQSYLTPHLGDNQQSLMPRIKTIELYRKNAKKSNDPVIQFQFAQYMLQTALLSGAGSKRNSGDASRAKSASPTKKSHNPNLNPGGTLTDEEVRLKGELLKEAVANLRRLSDKGFADAQYLLGDAYASGALGKPDLRESFTLFHLAAKHGHAEAAYRTALCLEEGWGTSKDIRRAVQFLRTAASKNQPGAMFLLGMSCFYGRMGLPNTVSTKQEGFKWLSRAAEAANEVYPQAPFELAKIYEVGYRDLVFIDMQYAVQLYVKSAELNYVPAAAKLGHAYEFGTLKVPQDAALSIHYYTIAALAGDAPSMLAMCAWYMVGAEPVLPRNEEEAFEWALRAAQHNLAKAQFAVGYFFEHGIGTERDLLQSSTWYRKAAAGGDERAIEYMKKSRAPNANSGKRGGDKDKDCIIS